ncbi:MAG TPA: DNA methyltransferase [Gemmataceae bacterium]
MARDARSQLLLFPAEEMATVREAASSTFVENMALPVHRWFRYSAGFSAEWVESVIAKAQQSGPAAVLDPFAGAGTTLIAAEKLGVPSCGVEAHPFVTRIARAKLLYRSDPQAFLQRVAKVKRLAQTLTASVDDYPPLIRKCFTDDSLTCLDQLRRAWEKSDDQSPASQLVWLALVAILRSVSHAGTAPWQYVLPRKSKRLPVHPLTAFEAMTAMIAADMRTATRGEGPSALLVPSDARTCAGVLDQWANLVITSPPYANNYDYADATRLEMCFLREIDGWGDLQQAVRQHLIRSCSQHVPERAVDLEQILSAPELAVLREEIAKVCAQLASIRQHKGGKKTYHLMVAAYFLDLAQVWRALRRVCQRPSRVCFVLGDSAPYGIYVPVMQWLGRLALAAGFTAFEFEKTRDRNVKWKNRKHRVPLCEGRLWVQG